MVIAFDTLRARFTRTRLVMLLPDLMKFRWSRRTARLLWCCAVLVGVGPAAAELQAQVQPASVEQQTAPDQPRSDPPAAAVERLQPTIPLPTRRAQSEPPATGSAQPPTLVPLPVLPRDATLDRMLGQMIMVGFHGRRVSQGSVQEAVTDVRTGVAGGIIFMDRNIGPDAHIRTITRALLDAAPEPTLPPFISVDQEGGAVQRINARGRFRRYPSAWRLARDGQTTERAETVYATLAQQLADLGFNLNFGPVVDLRTNAHNPIIARRNRSFGADVDIVGAFARTFIHAHRDRGLLTSLKHFPGHGSSLGDTHAGFVDITKTWRDAELGPFAELIASDDADMVMTGHLYHSGLSEADADADARLPATLAPGAINKLLRTQLGYKGVVITDDLAMGAIRQNYTLKVAVEGAVLAGVDIILITSDKFLTRGLALRLRDILADAVLAGRISRGRITESFARINALKARMLQSQSAALAAAASAEAKATAAEASTIRGVLE